MANNSSFGCPDPWGNPRTAHLLLHFNFWFGGIFYCCLGFFGLLGNLITILIFQRKEMKSTFHILLIILAFADLGYIAFNMIDKCLVLDARVLDNPHTPINTVWVHLYPTFLYPVQQMFMSFSIYMTVAICLNRYMCIVYPLKFSSHCSPCDTLSTVSFYCAMLLSFYYGISILLGRL